jgi:hypothetical protein
MLNDAECTQCSYTLKAALPYVVLIQFIHLFSYLIMHSFYYPSISFCSLSRDFYRKFSHTQYYWRLQLLDSPLTHLSGRKPDHVSVTVS